MAHHPTRTVRLAPTRLRPRSRPTRFVGVVLLGAAVLGACSSSDGDDAAPKATTTSTEAPAEPPTTTAPAAPDEPDTTTSTTEAAGDPDADAWARDATDLEDQLGEQFDIECPGPGVASAIWGTETYTTDSSICTAAVHVGLIDLEDGGEVTIEIAPGLDRYESGRAHELTSRRYLAYVASFTFPEAPPGSGEFVTGVESWDVSAATLGLEEGDTEVVPCSPDGAAGGVWGTDTYTSDSSICTAAVHAGLISIEVGGDVAIEVVAGQDAYEGSEANGITSNDFSRYDLSFTFADDQPEAPDAPADADDE